MSFQNKQMELGDKMDLASYLLKPIQRMSKYALLLKDLIKECSQSQEQELSDLRTAEEMVKFQLRHGNDLLAMDAIRGCDVSSNTWAHSHALLGWLFWCQHKSQLPLNFIIRQSEYDRGHSKYFGIQGHLVMYIVEWGQIPIRNCIVLSDARELPCFLSRWT